jgi:hypothetical protein
MPRKRMVDPAMFTSESVAALPVATRWTWVGLLCYLDDTGRGKDNPALVRAAVWPLDESYTVRKVRTDLDRLVAGGQVCRYVCCSSSQIHSPTWTDWQKISHPTPTKLCPCPHHERDAHRLHTPESLRRDSGAAPPSAVEVSEEKSSSGDCAHGVDRHASCSRCASGLRVIS